MIIWGGAGSDGMARNDGAVYDIAGNSWTAISSTGVAAVRFYHSAVWTGSEMIVWGGEDISSFTFNTGGRYSP